VDNKKKDELELFKKFRSTGDKRYFQQLYTSMKPLIYDAAKKSAYGSNLPESAHKIYTANVFLDALNTYNPKHGAALATHVYSAVHNKSKRLNYEYGNLGSMPEPRALKVGLFQNEVSNLQGELGREPSAAEIADRMNMGVRDVARMQKELTKDLAIGEGTEEIAFSEGSKEEEVLNHLYYDLTQEERVVYEYMTGKYGKPKLVKKGVPDINAIASKTGMPPAKVKRTIGGIKRKYERAVR
jgi:DNA-directed RNA polymerase specialized sigma subunit